MIPSLGREHFWSKDQQWKTYIHTWFLFIFLQIQIKTTYNINLLEEQNWKCYNAWKYESLISKAASQMQATPNGRAVPHGQSTQCTWQQHDTQAGPNPTQTMNAHKDHADIAI